MSADEFDMWSTMIIAAALVVALIMPVVFNRE